MKLSELKVEWEKDSKFNQMDLGGEARHVSSLHSKYLAYLINYKLQLRKAEAELVRLRRDKRGWFMGEMSREELTERQWEPFLKAKPLKSEVDRTVIEDDDIINQTNKVDYLRVAVSSTEYIMKAIESRGWNIKTAFEFRKFESGG